MAIGSVVSGAHPIKVANHLAVNTGMNVMGLRPEQRLDCTFCDGLCEIVGRRSAQNLVNVRKMFAVKLVKLPIVGRVVLRAIPPVPITALGDKKLFERSLPLLFRTALIG